MNKNVFLSGSLAVFLLFSGNYVNAQTSECKVKIPAISGTYSGGCKNGLADGMGIAQGVVLYNGQFREGTYTWAGGNYYEGSWRYGLKDGKGKLVSGDSTVSGYWRAGTFVGKTAVPSYKVTRSLSVIRSTIIKSDCADNQIKMQFLRAGVANAAMSGFTLAYTSGNEFRAGSYIGLNNLEFPVDIKVTFNAYNYFRTAQYEVIFEFTINEPGCWNINVSY